MKFLKIMLGLAIATIWYFSKEIKMILGAMLIFATVVGLILTLEGVYGV